MLHCDFRRLDDYPTHYAIFLQAFNFNFKIGIISTAISFVFSSKCEWAVVLYWTYTRAEGQWLYILHTFCKQLLSKQLKCVATVVCIYFICITKFNIFMIWFCTGFKKICDQIWLAADLINFTKSNEGCNNVKNLRRLSWPFPDDIIVLKQIWHRDNYDWHDLLWPLNTFNIGFIKIYF